MNDLGMSEAGKEESSVWPPPPAGPSSEAVPPKTPRVTDQTVGRVSLGLSGLGSLCALACVLFSSVADPNNHWASLYDALFIGSGVCFVAGFFVGFVGWYSWEGKVGLCLAVFLPPFWVVVGFIVAVTHWP